MLVAPFRFGMQTLSTAGRRSRLNPKRDLATMLVHPFEEWTEGYRDAGNYGTVTGIQKSSCSAGASLPANGAAVSVRVSVFQAKVHKG